MAATMTRSSLPQSVLFIHIYILLLCSFCFVLTLTQEGNITCSVPSVYPYQDTVLTCHFPEDLSATKKDFTVYHYVHQGRPDAVVDCWWVRGALDCFVTQGFTYDRTVNTGLSIQINHVTSEDTGSYACQIANYGSNLLQTCELNLERGENTTCNVAKGLDDLWLNLTCFFNEDVQKTKKNFTVYQHDIQDKLSVIRCWWEDGQPTCQGDVSFLYDKKVSSYLEMAIKRDKHKKASVYSCWPQGSVSDRVKTCSFVANNSESEEKTTNSVAIGVSLGILIAAVLVVVGIFVFKRWRKLSKTAEETQNDAESQRMLPKKWDQVTENFQDFLLKNVRQTFPNMLNAENAFYFVPPNFFNKTQCKTERIADDVIYVHEPPDPSEVRHDQAMQHVLHCLRHMADHSNEQMFVLTQFRYEDYLNSPETDFKKHRLPLPAGLNKKDRTIGCFDILIIHRVHGVVVAVVKCVNEKEEDSRDNKRRTTAENQDSDAETQNRENPDRDQRTENFIVKEVSEAIQELKKAERMIRHLMSDQDNSLSVQPTLILPNVTSSTLQRVFINNPELTENFRDCINMSSMDNPTALCLCSDHLSNPSAPWKVDSTVMSNLRTWLNSSRTDGQTMSSENYEKIISRFCGPATTSYIQAANKPEHYRLPKTLGQAVSVTGDLFERLTLYPGMKDLLEEPLVFLIGLSGTGKTKMLSLVGRTWISKGHKVCVVNTWPEGRAAAMQLQKLLQKTSGTSSSSPVQATVVSVYCNIENDRTMHESINSLVAHAEENSLFVLVDELPPEKAKTEEVISFLTMLQERVEKLHMWVASYRSDISPPGWRGKILTESISCPPSVVRETEQCSPGISKYSTNKYLLPSDGLPVITIRHRGPGHVERDPRDCEVCGEETARILKEDLCVCDKDTVIDIVDTPSPQRMQGPPSTLQYRDVLMLFESNVTEGAPMVTCLKNREIPVQVISSRDQESVLQDDSNSVLVAKAGFLYGLKRKVVVYVEGHPSVYVDNRAEFYAKWNRLRGITSCTSQLIFIRMS